MLGTLHAQAHFENDRFSIAKRLRTKNVLRMLTSRLITTSRYIARILLNKTKWSIEEFGFALHKGHFVMPLPYVMVGLQILLPLIVSVLNPFLSHMLFPAPKVSMRSEA